MESQQVEKKWDDFKKNTKYVEVWTMIWKLYLLCSCKLINALLKIAADDVIDFLCLRIAKIQGQARESPASPPLQLGPG